MIKFFNHYLTQYINLAKQHSKHNKIFRKIKFFFRKLSSNQKKKKHKYSHNNKTSWNKKKIIIFKEIKNVLKIFLCSESANLRKFVLLSNKMQKILMKVILLNH